MRRSHSSGCFASWTMASASRLAVVSLPATWIWRMIDSISAMPSGPPSMSSAAGSSALRRSVRKSSRGLVRRSSISEAKYCCCSTMSRSAATRSSSVIVRPMAATDESAHFLNSAWRVSGTSRITATARTGSATAKALRKSTFAAPPNPSTSSVQIERIAGLEFVDPFRCERHRHETSVPGVRGRILGEHRRHVRPAFGDHFTEPLDQLRVTAWPPGCRSATRRCSARAGCA